MDSNDDKSPVRKGKAVLVIEDEYFISDLYKKALEKAGYEVTVVADGGVALKEAQTDKYDVILLDLMLPTITGVDILKVLKDQTKTPHLKSKIIITTNLDERPEIRADIDKLADAYLVKADISTHQLVEAVDKQLDKS